MQDIEVILEFLLLELEEYGMKMTRCLMIF